MAGVANRRQQQWETQLEDSVFLKGAIKPIVDDMTALKPPVPYALRQALKHMNKTIYFQDNGYGGGGAAAPAHEDAIYEYADWASWASLPAANQVERQEGLECYLEALSWNAFISEFGTPEERNDGRTQETAALSYIHLESFGELDDVRREHMLYSTSAFRALKSGAGAAGPAAGAGMRAEKPEKMTADMYTLELIEELKTRFAGDDMNWDGFKHILGNYPGIKVKFNNYLNNHASNVAWRAKTQPEQVREFITEFLEGFDDPGVRAKEACDRALAFRQKSNMPTGTYLEIKEMRFDEAIREGNTSGHVDPRIRDEPERCRNAVEKLLTPIEVAIGDHLTDVSLAGHVIAGYAMDHFTSWAVMVKQVRRLAIHKRLDPKASSTNATPYGKNMMKATQDNNTDSEGDGDKKGKGEFKFKNRWKNHRDREARSAAEGGGKGSGQRMLCNKLPNQSVFGQDDERVMPPHRPGGPANNFCVYFWHSEKCLKGDKCIYGGHVRKETYEKDPSKFKGVQLKDQKADKAKDQAASASTKEDTGAVAELAAKLGSAIDIMKGIAAAQQETSQAVEQFKKEQTASDIEKKKETERRKARYEARKASMLSAAGSDLSGGRSIKSQWDEQLSFMSHAELSEADEDS